MSDHKNQPLRKLQSRLQRCILFGDLSSEELLSLLSKIDYRVQNFKKNEVIFSPHQKTDTLGILLAGTVDVQKVFSCGKILTVNRRFAPELIADASIFADITHYPSSILAVEESLIFFINRENLLRLFSLNENIMARFLQSVSNRVLLLNNTIEILSMPSVMSKIAWYLLNAYKRQQSANIKMVYTKKALAEHLNVSRTTLSRELKALKEDGVISFSRKSITILDLEKLENLCSQPR